MPMVIVCTCVKFQSNQTGGFGETVKTKSGRTLANNNNFNTRPPKVINDFERGVFKMLQRIFPTEKGHESSANIK